VKRPATILVATYQGYPGDTETPFLTPILTKLVERGHTLRIIFGSGVRQTRLPVSDKLVHRLADIGATLVPFRQPESHPFDNLPPVKGLVGRWIPAQFQGIPRQTQTLVWAPAWADNVAAELRRTPADIVIADFVLLGALAGAEAARVPCVALQHTVGIRPSAGLPPYATGWQPGRGPLGKARDALGRFVIECLYRRNGLGLLNAARTGLGLAPLRSAFEQYDRASRVLMLVSRSLDFPRRELPANIRFVGTPIADSGVSAWQAPWPPESEKRALVVVSLSTLPQGQESLLRNVLLELSRLDVRALVTLGPSLDPTEFVAPPNVVLERFVPHSAVLPQAAVLVTQCGIGTVTKGLVYGVPLVCVPILADQPDNAARVVARGAGIYVPSDAPPEQIGAAIQRVLNDGKFRSAAQQLGAAIAREGDAVDNAISAIEDLLQPVPAGVE
jgi:UDP:flavonoid glycosyltransferase YjiC (YdhE family)